MGFFSEAERLGVSSSVIQLSFYHDYIGRLEFLDGYNKELLEHRLLFKGLCMTAADLSDQSKDFHNSKSIAVGLDNFLLIFYKLFGDSLEPFY